MSTTADLLPITETIEPADRGELLAAVRDACAAETAIYPIGGGTSLDFGLPAHEAGIGLSLARLDDVIDYPARDMTITLEAGVTMADLARTLSAQGQRLPIDVPRADQATLGGVVATNFSGARRYGSGTIRDYVIGIEAVDGRGTPFQGGGRVVKNVAGYDFCKLLTGSLGTLGVIARLTLKLRPLPERSSLLACRVADWPHADRLLASLVDFPTPPAAIELLAGPAWQDDPALANIPPTAGSAGPWLVVGLEGTEPEVDWMTDQLAAQWRSQAVGDSKSIGGEEAERLWGRLADFPAEGESPLAIKATVLPSATTRFIQTALEVDPGCSIQAHAGNGIVLMKFSEFPPAGLSRALTGKLRPAATSAQGNLIVLSNPKQVEVTHQSVWGGISAPLSLMARVKKQFDPKNLLNRDRFIYP